MRGRAPGSAGDGAAGPVGKRIEQHGVVSGVRLKATCCLAFAVAFAGCTTGAAAPRPVEIETPSPPTTASPEAPNRPDDTPSLERRAQRAICGNRDGCSLLKLRPAGVRGDETLFAAFAQLGHEPPGDKLAPSEGSPLTTDGEIEMVGAELGGCAKLEVWLVASGPRGVTSERLLGEVCNDGYGAAGIGEDSFAFDGKGSLVHSRNGGSAWRWGETVTIALDPPTILERDWNGSWNMADNVETTSFDFRTLSGTTSWEINPCDASGTPPMQQGGPVEAFAYAAIPSLRAGGVPAGVDLKRTPLAACSTTIDGATLGHLLDGSADSSSSRMKLLAFGGTLHVEIEDDAFVETGARRDEIEVWFASKMPDYTEQCLPKQGRPSGFAIPIVRGPVRTLQGSMAEPDVTRETAAKGATSRKLAIEILPATEGLTVVYRDTDDGKKVGRVIATSELDTKRDATLGRLREVEASQAHCVLVGGSLSVVVPPVADEKAVFGF